MQACTDLVLSLRIYADCMGHLYSLPYTHVKDWQLERHQGTSSLGEGISALMWAVAVGWWYHSMPSRVAETNKEAVAKSPEDTGSMFPLDISNDFCE